MPDPNYAALAAEGRRMWSAYVNQEITNWAAWAWFDLNHDALLAACERFSLLEEANRKLSTSLRKHSDAVNEQAERLAGAEQLAADLRMAVESANGMAKIYHDRLMDNKAKAEQRCAELAAALEILIGGLTAIRDDANDEGDVETWATANVALREAEAALRGEPK